MKTINLLRAVAAFSGAVFLTQLTDAQPASAGRGALSAEAQPFVHIKQDAAQPAATASPTGYSPAQIRNAYGFDLLDSSIDGSGQTIAIVDAFGDRYATITSTSGRGNKTTTTTTITDATQTDWTTFCTQFGLPLSGLTVAYPQGQPANVNTNWALETALDIQWAHAMAPGANILLVVSYDNSTANLLTAVDYAVAHGASVVSMSWGGSESGAELASDAHFKYPGVTFVASSGDNGELSSGLSYPAASPYVVSVGGTTLTNIDGAWEETAWSGSGGGISLYETIPSFQNGWQQFPTGNMRSVPDVSYTGGPGSALSVYCSPYAGWIRVYGTSVGAPQWAALIGLVNSKSSFGTLSSANPVLYSIAASKTTPPLISTDYLIDIASGNNGSDPDDGSITGYDFVTGLGSPMANQLVPELISVLSTPNFYLSVSPSADYVPALAADGTSSWTVTYQVMVNRLGGFTGDVALSVSGYPDGATVGFASTSTADTFTLSIMVPTTASAGTYSLTITATPSTLSNPIRTAPAFLTVCSTPTIISVVQPSGSSGYSVSGGKNNNANLTVQVLLRDNFGNPVAGASVSTGLYLNGTYYGSATATTASDGTVSFLARNAPAGTYTTRVTNITGTTLPWDGITPTNSYTKIQ